MVIAMVKTAVCLVSKASVKVLQLVDPLLPRGFIIFTFYCKRRAQLDPATARKRFVCDMYLLLQAFAFLCSWVL